MTPFSIPQRWRHCGLVLQRSGLSRDNDVAGDPCIVWDDDASTWRMFLFYAPPGHGQAICRDPKNPGPKQWEFLGPLPFQNPGALMGGATHKPFVVMLPDGSNRAAKVDGKYWLLCVSFDGKKKVIQRAHANRLEGPWILEEGALLKPGEVDDFDGKHVDAVSGYYFEKSQEFFYYYMGYPQNPQARSGTSPLGSVQALAVQPLGQSQARKLGPVLPPCSQAGHWASGWVGGLQLFPGKEHRWIGLVNASPTAPGQSDTRQDAEEPAPSLGGFAWTDSEVPDSGWNWAAGPIEFLDDLPEEARQWGEGNNLWRHHILTLPEKRYLLFYNSGSYGQEQLYLKEAIFP